MLIKMSKAFVLLMFLLSGIALVQTINISVAQSLDSTPSTSNTTLTTDNMSSIPPDVIENLMVSENPFYAANTGKIIGQRVLSVAEGPVQIEQSIMENGLVKNVGNVTNIATWVNTFRSENVIYGVGNGIMSTDDGQMATWTAHDIGHTDDKGVITYRGVMFFNANPSGVLGFLNNVAGLYITQVEGDKQTTKIWQWN